MGLGFPRGKAAPETVDRLQISGATMAPSDGPSPVELADAGRAPHGLGVFRDQYVRKVRKTPTIRMVPSSMRVEGRLLQFAVSDNVDAHGPGGPGTPPIWAVNIHGYFAGGGMYWRESARLAEQLGWRVINPSLPGFGGSDPLGWHDVSMPTLADQVMAVLHHVGAGPAVVLGHSMGGAVAVQFAHDHPRHCLGVIYRDGVSTPAWKARHGIVATLLSPFAANVAPMADLALAVVGDLPDLFIGRMFSTVRSVLPDVRRNIASVGQTLPVGSLLMSIDQRREVRALVGQQMPIVNEWGCFDRITPGATATEFAEVARAPVQWVPGGHSWMLARPQGQSDILLHLAAGKEFMSHVESRWRQFSPRDHVLHAVN
jgi:pimeloyl-ACP methyl ester carboxylesterase